MSSDNNKKEEIIDFINEVIKILNLVELNAKMFFLRDTRSKKENNRFELQTLDIQDSVPVALKNILSQRLSYVYKDLENDVKSINDFYSESYSGRDVSMIPDAKQDISHLDEILYKISPALEIINDVSEMQKFETYAVQFESYEENNEKIVYFRKITKASLLSKKWYTKLSISHGKVDYVDEDVFAVDQYVDCIYMEKYDKLLVLHKPNTEQIFNFKSYYEKYAKQAFNSIKKMGFVEIDSELINNTLKSTVLVKRMTKLQHSNAFDKQFKHFKSAYDHIKGNTNYKTDKFGLQITGNKVVIGKDKTKFESFLYLCDNGVVEDIVIKTPFLIKEKQLLK